MLDRESPRGLAGWGPSRGSPPRGVQEVAQDPELGPPLPRDIEDFRDIRVQLREQHLYYRDRLLPVSRILPHPYYYTVENGADIALLELQDPVNISSHVQVVTLPPASETFPPGTPCWVTGWGDVDNGGEYQGQREGWVGGDLVTPMAHPQGVPLGTGSRRAGSGSASLQTLGRGRGGGRQHVPRPGAGSPSDPVPPLLVPGKVTRRT